MINKDLRTELVSLWDEYLKSKPWFEYEELTFKHFMKWLSVSNIKETNTQEE